MNEQDSQRKLSVILHADVVGYSKMMARDDQETLRSLRASRQVFSTHIEWHHGRIVNTPGDAILAEFGNAEDALSAAVAVQQALAERNTALAREGRMRFRIGINIGDVLTEGEDIYGDGVNVAARLEGLALPGGVCISAGVHRQVHQKFPLQFRSLGRKKVKNIAQPLHAYHVMLPAQADAVDREARPNPVWRKWGYWPALLGAVLAVLGLAGYGLTLKPGAVMSGLAGIERPYPPLPEGPSIAVLAFENLSGEPELEYLGDGTAQEILTQLAKVPGLLVISRHSALSYKKRRINPRQVGKELGVRYLLLGSFRTANRRIRLAVHLVEARDGRQLWSAAYEGQVTDILDLQEQITQQVMEAMEISLTEGQQARVWRRSTGNSRAWLNFMQGVSELRKVTDKSVASSKLLFQSALKEDPGFSAAQTALGYAHYLSARYGYDDPARALEEAARRANQAIAGDPETGEAYCLLGMVHLASRQFERAAALCERGVKLAPNNGEMAALNASVLNYAGRPDKALAGIRRAMRLNPNYPDWYLYQEALANYLAGRHEQTVILFQRYLKRDPQGRAARLILAAAHGKLGQTGESQRVMNDFARHHPGLSPRDYLMQSEPFRERQVIEDILTAIGNDPPR